MKLKFDTHIKLKQKISLFVKCRYDEDCIPIIHSFGRKYYHSNVNMWELPCEAFPILCECKDVVICGNIPNKYKQYLELLNIYDMKDEEYFSKTSPFEHQLDSFEYAKSHSKFLLGDEQGLGKTKQALDIAVSRKNKMKHCLIVCGVNGLKWNWLNEIHTHTNEEGFILGSYIKNNKMYVGSVNERLQDLRKPHDEFFIITNIETLRDDNIGKQIRYMCDKGVIGMTIIDEIHKCKNYSSQQGKAIHNCCSYYKLALTGTPLMNSPMDLYNILKWLGYENHTYSQFESYYAIKGGFGGYQIVGYQHLDELQELLDLHMLRRKKEDVLDLPDKIHINEYVEMNNNQEKIYKEVLSSIRKDIDKILLDPNPLSQLTRLRQATANPSLLTTKKVTSSKLERMVELVEESVDNGDKVIIFSNYSKNIYEAVEMLKQFNPSIVTGDIKEIDEQITKFKCDSTCKVICGTIGCLGTGFTLTEASTIIFIDECWTMANKVQAEDRAHRIGTKSNVRIYTLMCKNTIDERIHELVEKKGIMSDCLVDKQYSVDDIKFLLS